MNECQLSDMTTLSTLHKITIKLEINEWTIYSFFGALGPESNTEDKNTQRIEIYIYIYLISYLTKIEPKIIKTRFFYSLKKQNNCVKWSFGFDGQTSILVWNIEGKFIFIIYIALENEIMKPKSKSLNA